MSDKPKSDSVLERYTGRTAAGEASPPEPESTEDYGVFGWVRGVRERSLMLELRLKDGSVTSFGYAWLKKATFNPSEGITLDFSGETVTIVGRNLDAELGPRVRLFNGIVRHRVTWIQQADGAAEISAGPAAVVIEAIEIQ
ncbi:MAG: hypothetical protein JNK76_07215 [Planctomycetales bacterium]|nr:hypothetical protein [Planctomycetales bacterium]MBN8626914.1 hypothetical protein [Planctomycetota bacterium]